MLSRYDENTEAGTVQLVREHRGDCSDWAAIRVKSGGVV